MQTFLPSPSFKKSAQILDNKRLGKQRLEAKQILQINLYVKEKPKIWEGMNKAWGFCNNCSVFYGNASFCKNCGKALLFPNKPITWENHPAVKMWRGYEIALSFYGWSVCEEWKRRGFKDNQQPFFEKIAGDLRVAYFKDNYLNEGLYPEWMKNSQVVYDFCYSHRANLMRKDPIFYGKYNWKFFGDYTKEPYRWNEEFWK